MIGNAVAAQMSMAEATEVLVCSERQVKRLKGRSVGKLADWVYHGNRGKTPANRISETVRKQAVELAQGRYQVSTTRISGRSCRSWKAWP